MWHPRHEDGSVSPQNAQRHVKSRTIAEIEINAARLSVCWLRHTETFPAAEHANPVIPVCNVSRQRRPLDSLTRDRNLQLIGKFSFKTNVVFSDRASLITEICSASTSKYFLSSNSFNEFCHRYRVCDDCTDITNKIDFASFVLVVLLLLLLSSGKSDLVRRELIFDSNS